MDFIQSILMWFSQNILQNPAFFVGLLVLVGYMLLKKPAHEVFAGFIKATVGYLILNVGAGGLVTTFRPILVALATKFKLEAAVIDPYFGLAAANEKLTEIGFIDVATTALIIGFTVNILLVALRKITKVRTLFITGHIMVQQAATISVFVLILIPSLQGKFAALAVGIICGLYWAVSSNLTVEPTQRLTNGGGFAIGHQQQFAIWFVDKVAPFFGKKEDSLDNLKLPKFLNIFHDTVVASATLMIVFFGLILTILGKDIMSNAELIGGGAYNPAKSFFIYVLQTSLNFSVYLFILMQGVRMFVAELTNAFQGISSKLLKGSFPAVDVAASYGFGSTNAVLSGFVFGLIGQLITISLLVIFKNPVLIITGFVPVFFDNAAIAVFADKRGGWKAAAILSFISGILQVSLGAVAITLLGLVGGYHGNIDLVLPWLPFGYLFKYLGIVGYILVCLFLLILPQLQFARAKDKEAYYRGEAQAD
ncbi:PTS sugar transporter subunit IIC [Tuanshanicoccus lijuaniae]|uniref:PTS sugar transporter subunit IIC n=1 Tax=Aerococcaceae bacterium zg-1292 TaxID=2774330 RepID=UPI00193530A1|nr:PTS sugar transporter subunit IIC [Aerococcaceae bacterium zg-1292]MBF6625545.1 PTS sugar transporter subunit IIC [Aerococcaceae bacterium zg-BR9]MBF6977732.1 PTS sugar transporter subunit IIC [Aerococcaceae bacterium zg-BR22]MBS4456504.1 PTS sugar transporter subunit IIC [Aerococcaceae bacterium zg-A91]MBS4458605.1 PTS sugar transporter subunit IIC [Aerococcaceae bacterium zg-BR33]